VPRISLLLPSTLLFALAILSCSEEDAVGPPANEYKELTRRDHVIQSLEASYREGDIGEVDRVLNDNFSFCFTLDSRTRCWLRDDELAVIGGLMAGGGIDVKFAYPSGEHKWVANSTDPRNTDAIWEKLVEYTIRRERSASGLTVLTGRATFLIRRVQFEGSSRWRLTGVADHSGLFGEWKEQLLPED